MPPYMPHNLVPFTALEAWEAREAWEAWEAWA